MKKLCQSTLKDIIESNSLHVSFLPKFKAQQPQFMKKQFFAKKILIIPTNTQMDSVSREKSADDLEKNFQQAIEEGLIFAIYSSQLSEDTWRKQIKVEDFAPGCESVYKNGTVYFFAKDSVTCQSVFSKFSQPETIKLLAAQQWFEDYSVYIDCLSFNFSGYQKNNQGIVYQRVCEELIM